MRLVQRRMVDAIRADLSTCYNIVRCDENTHDSRRRLLEHGLASQHDIERIMMSGNMVVAISTNPIEWSDIDSRKPVRALAEKVLPSAPPTHRV